MMDLSKDSSVRSEMEEEPLYVADCQIDSMQRAVTVDAFSLPPLQASNLQDRQKLNTPRCAAPTYCQLIVVLQTP